MCPRSITLLRFGTCYFAWQRLGGDHSAPHDRGLRRALKATTNQLKRTRAAAVQRFFECYVSRLEGRIREGDQFGFYKHLKGMDVEEKRTFNSQYIKDEEGRLLRDNALIRERWVRWFNKLQAADP